MTSKLLSPGKLKHLSGNTYATSNAYYHPDYRLFTRLYAPEVTEIVEQLHDILGIRNPYKVILKPINCKVTMGLTLAVTHNVFIDPRRKDISDVSATLVHEMIHLQQLQSGRLSWNLTDGMLWDGEPVAQNWCNNAYAKDLDAYRNAFPWEMDVYKRQPEVYKQVLKKVSFYLKHLPFEPDAKDAKRDNHA